MFVRTYICPIGVMAWQQRFHCHAVMIRLTRLGTEAGTETETET